MATGFVLQALLHQHESENKTGTSSLFTNDEEAPAPPPQMERNHLFLPEESRAGFKKKKKLRFGMLQLKSRKYRLKAFNKSFGWCFYYLTEFG